MFKDNRVEDAYYANAMGALLSSDDGGQLLCIVFTLAVNFSCILLKNRVRMRAGFMDRFNAFDDIKTW